MNHPTLTLALRSNAVFSAVSGVTLLALALPLSKLFDVPASVLAAVGFGLLPFAWIVWTRAARPTPAGVRLIIAADVAWVVAASVILIGFSDAMSTQGSIALALASVAVADFAILQGYGLRRATRQLGT